MESCSFDRNAANVFQSYVQSALAFSIKRGGILYGTGEGGWGCGKGRGEAMGRGEERESYTYIM